MAGRRLKGGIKVAEECSELAVECNGLIKELMKLDAYPNGKHPRRKKNLILSVEEEIADVLAIIDYFVDKNKLNRGKITRRRAYKYRKWVKRWGAVPKTTKKTIKIKPKKQASKKRAAGQSSQRDASLIDATSI